MAKILDVKGRRVWDSRGRPTVEAEVIVGRGTTALATGRAIAPSGASTGAGEAATVDVRKAVHNIQTRIRDGLRALSVSDQEKLDQRLIDLDGTPDRSRLGANAMVAVSLACAQADAAAQKLPCGRNSRVKSAWRCPCRRSRSSAAARTRADAATCRTT